MEKLIILDGNSLINRAFYALPLLSNKKGTYTNAVYGFSNMLLKLKEDINPDYIVATFDKKAPTFRHLEYKDYKAGRKKMPPELAQQLPIVKEFLELLSVTIYELEGFEADDIIGTLANFAASKGIEVYIITGDKDALQLAKENIKVCITKKGVSEKEVYDEQRMIDEFGVTPTQFIDVKGLMGDKSDNIPGVPGIGEKTAFKLINTYGSIEEVLNNIGNISGKKLKENLTEYSEQAIFSKKLATIMTEVPIDFDLDEIKSQDNCDLNALRSFYRELEIKITDERLNSFANSDNVVLKEEVMEEANCKEIKNIEELKELKGNIEKEIFLTFKFVDEDRFSTLDIEKIFLNTKSLNYSLDFKALINNEESFILLKEIFEQEEIEKNTYKVKDALKVLIKNNITLKGIVFDCEIAAYLIDSSKGIYPLEEIINIYLSEYPKYEDEYKNEVLLTYVPKLTQALKTRIKDESMEKLLYEIELPLTIALSDMEAVGFKVDGTMLDDLSIKFKSEIEKSQGEIFELAEEEFNINSPKQLGKILFEKLDLPVIKKTKTGYSTNADVLDKLRDKHPIIDKITYFRQLSKIYSTYVEGLKNVIDVDGAIHSTFNQTVTTTGRLSSTEPNLQNIPIKYEMGREIRKVFIPREKDDFILSADYSQIELRVLAHMSQDDNMIKAFKEHSDIHTRTAAEVFNVKPSEVTSIMRSRAKAVNFGIIYGISDFSLSQDLKITRKEAKEYMDIYFERYPNIKKFIDGVLEEAKDLGFVKTMLNRRRFIPEIKASNKIVKALGERLAMNAPIQGTAADIIKLAMVNVSEELKNRKLKSKLILQVHDELILNVDKDELEEVKALVKDKMENVLKLDVPLDVDINIGKTWYEAK
ncbi:DNA polymerase I [Clostridium sp.]|uniref:DNA polymerase I n=1 Tax=Clostridium sp. TaxID=1506 RepID=UPI0039956C23